GENSRMVVTGDLTQIDLPPGARSGLTDAVETLTGTEGIAMVRFTEADVVRHPLVTRVVRAYEARSPAGAARSAPDRPGQGWIRTGSGRRSPLPSVSSRRCGASLA